MFTPDDEKTLENETGKIWSNVVIACKGKIKSELSAYVRGALMPRRPTCNTQRICNTRCIGGREPEAQSEDAHS